MYIAIVYCSSAVVNWAFYKGLGSATVHALRTPALRCARAAMPSWMARAVSEVTFGWVLVLTQPRRPSWSTWSGGRSDRAPRPFVGKRYLCGLGLVGHLLWNATNMLASTSLMQPRAALIRDWLVSVVTTRCH